MSSCLMCSGAIIHFKIKRIAVGETESYPGFPDFLRNHGVEVAIADDPNCLELMRNFIKNNPELWD